MDRYSPEVLFFFLIEGESIILRTQRPYIAMQKIAVYLALILNFFILSGTMFRSHSLEFLRERLWFALSAVTVLFLLVLYMTAGAVAFFILGPALLFFFALTQFPRIYLWMNNLEAEHGPQYLRTTRLAQKLTRVNGAPPRWIISSQVPIRHNVLLFASGRTHWFMAHPALIEALSDQELEEILAVTQELFFHTVTQRASLLSALQYFLFFLPWTHHRGNELSFYSVRDSHKWSRLMLEQSLRPANSETVPRYMAPSLLFPVLTNYNKTSYYSLYVHLRDQWIEHYKKELYKPSEDL